jgi:O-antigen biosynthesis protein WbqP
MAIYKYIKRTADIFLSAAGIMIASPFMLILCIACSLDTRSSPFFLQERMGRNLSVFKIIKFRTMKKTAPSCTPARNMERCCEYVSRFGRFMRKSGLDELPQLINIFLGQMSFIGPRPLMLSEKTLHEERARLGVYRVRPGITGIAQIRSGTIDSVKAKAELDSLYTANVSFLTDAKILLATLGMLLSGKHIDEHFYSPSE